MSSDDEFIASEAEKTTDLLSHMVMIYCKVLLSRCLSFLTDSALTVLLLQDFVIRLKSDSEFTS